MRLLLIALLALAALLSGCGPESNGTTTAPGADNTKVAAVVAASEMVVGKNRFPIGLIRGGAPLNEPAAQVQMTFYNLSSATPNDPLATEQASYYGSGLPAGLYVSYPSFASAGSWRVEIAVQLPDMAAPEISNRLFDVLDSPMAVAPGQPAVSITTPTVNDGKPLEQITSALQPDPALYQVSVDQAIKLGKPTVLLFATPAFCRTAVCAPNMLVLSDLAGRFADQASFIHVEVYPYPFSDNFRAGKVVPAMEAWNLRTEPWLYLIDAQGMVVARYEGGITREEIEPAIERLISGQPPLP